MKDACKTNSRDQKVWDPWCTNSPGVQVTNDIQCVLIVTFECDEANCMASVKLSLPLVRADNFSGEGQAGDTYQPWLRLVPRRLRRDSLLHHRLEYVRSGGAWPARTCLLRGLSLYRAVVVFSSGLPVVDGKEPTERVMKVMSRSGIPRGGCSRHRQRNLSTRYRRGLESREELVNGRTITEWSTVKWQCFIKPRGGNSPEI